MLISKLTKEKNLLTNSIRNKPYMVFAKALFFLFTINLFLFSPAFAGGVDEKIAEIQKAYEDIKDMSGDFVQKSFIKDLKRTETFKGQFFIKRPMKMKWSYKGNNAQDVLINNDLITIYQKKEKQAFRGKFDRDTYGQAPIALLSGFGKIREEFAVSDQKGRLVLKPKKPMGEIITIEIETAEEGFPIKSFTINDSLSNRIEMTLKDVRINSGLEDTFFELTLPKGVTVLDQGQ
jgi:outer membrane lipoprotein carrier protein